MSETLHADLAATREQVNAALDQRLPTAEQWPGRLHAAMRHAVLAGGKRLRPVLCLAAAEAIGGDPDTALLPALAIELLHTYTLVHDDLPCMDDDDLRRGQPTVHIAFDEATAVLAGDALLTLAFEWLAEHGDPVLIQLLANHAGSRGVIGGQIDDIASESGALPPGEEPAAVLERIHRNKTGALITASLSLGALAVREQPDARNGAYPALMTFGEHIGLAFQIADDILDTTADTETLGKPAGSDDRNEKLTYVSLHGLDAARDQAAFHLQSALDALDTPGIDSGTLAPLARFLVTRGN